MCDICVGTYARPFSEPPCWQPRRVSQPRRASQPYGNRYERYNEVDRHAQFLARRKAETQAELKMMLDAQEAKREVGFFLMHENREKLAIPHAPAKLEVMVPCELCQQQIPFDQYQAHAEEVHHQPRKVVDAAAGVQRKFKYAWQDEHNNWHDYLDNIQDELEAVYHTGGVMDFHANSGHTYTLDPRHGRQTNKNSGQVRAIKRVPISQCVISAARDRFQQILQDSIQARSNHAAGDDDDVRRKSKDIVFIPEDPPHAENFQPQENIENEDEEEADAQAQPEDEEENEEKDAGKMCVICDDSLKEVCILPCGHVCLCEKCDAKYFKGPAKKKCPVCRGDAVNTVKVYF